MVSVPAFGDIVSYYYALSSRRRHAANHGLPAGNYHQCFSITSLLINVLKLKADAWHFQKLSHNANFLFNIHLVENFLLLLWRCTVVVYKNNEKVSFWLCTCRTDVQKMINDDCKIN